MIKNLTGGSVINYGPTLPTDATVYDGTLFYKTGTGEGLYLFSFTQDVNTAAPGDQVGQGWNTVSTAGSYVSRTGDEMTGLLKITTTGTSANFGTGEQSLIFNNIANNGGWRSGGLLWTYGNGNTVSAQIDTLQGFQNNKATVVISTRGATGQLQERLKIDENVMTFNGQAIYHQGNDGTGSGLDADLFQGQPPSFYRNAANITGQFSQGQLPFVPVQQGGGTSQLANKIYIGWSTGSKLFLQIDATNFSENWPINVTGSSGSTNYANTAGSATTATNATSAQYLRQNAEASGTNMQFQFAGQAGQPTWIWGTTTGDGSLWQVYNPSSFNVNYAATSGATGLATFAQYVREGASPTGAALTLNNDYRNFNRIYNPDFSYGPRRLASWGISSNETVTNWGVNLGTTWWLSGQGEDTWGANFAYVIAGPHVDNAYTELYGTPISVVAGTRYIYSAYTGAHRCKVQIILYLRNSNGDFVGTNNYNAAEATNNNEAAGGTTLNAFKRLYSVIDMPAGVTSVQPIIRKWSVDAGNSDNTSYLFTGQILFEEVRAGVNTPSPWQQPNGVWGTTSGSDVHFYGPTTMRVAQANEAATTKSGQHNAVAVGYRRVEPVNKITGNGSTVAYGEDSGWNSNFSIGYQLSDTLAEDVSNMFYRIDTPGITAYLGTLPHMPIGSIITIDNNTGGTVSLFQGGGGPTLRMAGTSTVNNFYIGAWGTATCFKNTANSWKISGSGVTA